MRVDFGRTCLVLPGDIAQETEARIFRGEPWPARVLVASPHHGSDFSNGPALFDFLRPAGIVFSCGYENRFGLPAARVLDECGGRAIPVYRTDLNGAVHAVSDGLEWTITTESGGTSKSYLGKPKSYYVGKTSSLRRIMMQ